MSAGNLHNWRDKCYGRDELLKKLRDAYTLTVAGMPQFLVLKGMTAVGLIPGVGLLANIPGWIKDGWEWWTGKKKKAAAEAKAKQPVLVSQQEAEREAIEQMLNTLKLFLDRTQKDLSTQRSSQIPVVHFLNDAHWGGGFSVTSIMRLPGNWKMVRVPKML